MRQVLSKMLGFVDAADAVYDDEAALGLLD
jgi:hypothetical protein